MTAVPEPPGIALGSLSIHNFRGIENLDLDFQGPDGNPNRLVVLAGPNGCGKTAILEAARMIIQGDHRFGVGEHGLKAIRLGARNFSIQGSLIIDTIEEHRVISFPNSRQTPLDQAKPVNHWYFSSWRAPQHIGSVDVTVGRPGRRPAKNDTNRLLYVKQQLVNRAAVDKFQSGQHSSISPYSELINSINAAWDEFYPESGAEFFVDLTRPDVEGSGAFDVFLRCPEGNRLEVDQLSAGQLELFLFVSALALNDHGVGIILIDEPELHLDPQWHRPILRSLMKLQPRAQFIVATHSPEIYDAARSYERHFLVPEDDPRARLWGEARSLESGV
jgi:energy-coupling factor transporter ATP-binding protein EcfA2